MFKAMAADIAGTSDNCSFVAKSHFGDPTHVDSLSFVRHTETVRVFLKSKIYEFIFTDKGLIRIERDNAAGVKRFITRQDWQIASIDLASIKFTTPGAGMTDYACEIDFNLGNMRIHIEVVKAEIEKAKMLFLFLVELASEQQRNAACLSEARLNKSQIILSPGAGDTASLVSFQSALARDLLNQFAPISYASVFEKFDF